MITRGSYQRHQRPAQIHDTAINKPLIAQKKFDYENTDAPGESRTTRPNMKYIVPTFDVNRTDLPSLTIQGLGNRTKVIL